MNDSQYISYEAAVHWMRSQPQHEELVRLSYLDVDNLEAGRRFAQSEEWAQVAQWAQLNNAALKPRAVLDVGCGNGIASYAMGMMGHHVTALDPDLSADVGLEATRRFIPLVEAAGGKLVCVQGFAESLALPDASLDVVYARQAFHHFSDLEKGVHECARVLKPGGVLVATREHVVDDEAQLREFLAGHTLHHKHGGENAYPLERYVTALQAAGFKDIEVFKPWDTVVNHFPLSNADVRNVISQGVRKRVKVPLDVLAFRVPGFEALMRQRLNGWNDYPGRLFSFVAQV